MDVKLTEITSDDLELIRGWRNQADVAKYMYTDDQITQQQQETWYNRIQQDSSSQYWLIEYNDQKVGLASLTGINPTLSSCYWAFYLGNAISQGAGVGSKIEFNVIDYVFNTLKLNKLRCEVITFNEKVIAMHEKFGFRREAYYRQHVKKEGKWQDVVGLAMLREEWKTQREVMKARIYRQQ